LFCQLIHCNQCISTLLRNTQRRNVKQELKELKSIKQLKHTALKESQQQKCKFFLPATIRQPWGVEVQLHSFLNSEFGKSGWLTSRSRRLCPSTASIEGLMGKRAGTVGFGDHKISHSRQDPNRR